VKRKKTGKIGVGKAGNVGTEGKGGGGGHELVSWKPEGKKTNVMEKPPRHFANGTSESTKNKGELSKQGKRKGLSTNGKTGKPLGGGVIIASHFSALVTNKTNRQSAEGRSGRGGTEETWITRGKRQLVHRLGWQGGGFS